MSFVDDLIGIVKRVGEGFADTYNGKLTTNAMELAGGIARGEYKELMTTKGFGSAVERNMRSLAKASDIDLDAAMMRAVRGGNFDVASEMISKMDVDQADKIASMLLESKSAVGSKLQGMAAADSFIKTGADGAYASVDSGLAQSYYKAQREAGKMGKAEYAMKATQSYFTEPGKQKARIGAAVGTYAAGSVGVRLLDGGTLTRNSSGERDIAGLPFF